jgi:glycosyltransferase involved in cell wall biosynthesis
LKEVDVSITALIPTYNRRIRVLSAIASVLTQTMSVDEVVVIDDGSTDGTADAIDAGFGARVTVIRQENAGVSAARNRGIRAAHSEWIAFLDSDDLWHSTKIERQFAAIEASGGAAGACFTDNSFAGNPKMTETMFAATGFSGAGKMGLFDETAQHILSGTEPFFTSSFMARRSLLLEVGGFDEELVLREDTDLFFRLCFRTPFCFAGDPLVVIDRTTSRELGLCKLYSTRDDRKNYSLERLFGKWMAMPEVIGTNYEDCVRQLLRRAYFNSLADKLHQLRLKDAFRVAERLRNMSQSYTDIFVELLMRKIGKLRRKC